MSGDELARVEQGTALSVATMGNATQAMQALSEWIVATKHAGELVAQLVDTPFFPTALRVKLDPRATQDQRDKARRQEIANGTAAVLQGITLGLDPLTAMQQVYIINMRPGMYAKMMVALVQSHGHEIWTEEDTDSRAIVAGRRKGSENIERVTVTMEQARKGGWTSNQQYGKTPRDMLWSRAAARVCDRVASDVLKGIACVDEIQDTISANAEVGTGRRTISPPARRAVGAMPESHEPTIDDELLTDDETRQANPASGIRVEPAAYVRLAPIAEPSEPAGQALDPTQWRHINDELRRLGINGERQQARRLERIERIVRRAIARGSDLTYEEGGIILGVLRAEPTPEPESAPPPAEPAAQPAAIEEAWPNNQPADELLDDDWPPTAQPPATPDTPEATP